MPSPPKPWEVNSGTAVSATPVVSQTSSAMTDTTTSSALPTVPNRPTMGTTTIGGIGPNYGGYGTSGYGTSGYGGYGTSSYGGYGSTYGTGGYGSTYNRFGGGYGGYGSSYGGYGSSYGGYGSTYGTGGYGGMGYGMNRIGNTGFGGPDGPMGPEDFSLSQRMESSTRATFDLIQSIVGAFGGFAQMLDSTYMATHSSFMAMVGVAEQFGNLKHYLGGIFSIFALIRFLKRIMYRVTGRTPPPELYGPGVENTATQALELGGETVLQLTENGEETAEGQVQQQQQQQQQQQPQQVSRKRPILIFLALITGLPYFMYKLIQRSNQLRQQQQRMMIPQYGLPPPEPARVMHDFVAENPIELTIRRGEMIHVLSKVDPATGAPCEWWQGKNAHGVIGIFPANYVQLENPGY